MVLSRRPLGSEISRPISSAVSEAAESTCSTGPIVPPSRPLGPTLHLQPPLLDS